MYRTKLYGTIALAGVLLTGQTFLETYLSLKNKSTAERKVFSKNNILGQRDKDVDYHFIVNVPTNLAKGVTVNGEAVFNGDQK